MKININIKNAYNTINQLILKLKKHNMNKQTMLITAETAKAIYPTVPESFKRDLEDMFGKNLFYTKIEDRIKSFEDACRELNMTSEIKLDVSALSKNDQKYFIANYKLSIIIKALNEGWEPNWNNSNEYKYYPWFTQSPSGFGFSVTSYADWVTITGAGSRLCYKSRDLAVYAAEQFESIYKDLMLL